MICNYIWYMLFQIQNDNHQLTVHRYIHNTVLKIKSCHKENMIENHKRTRVTLKI